jgi:hypothetical protein
MNLSAYDKSDSRPADLIFADDEWGRILDGWATKTRMDNTKELLEWYKKQVVSYEVEKV